MIRFTFDEESFAALSDEAQEKLGDDREIEVETLSEFATEFEDVTGLKSSLSKSREQSRKWEKSREESVDIQMQNLKTETKDTLAEKDGEIATLKTQLSEQTETISGLESSIKTTSQDKVIAEAVSKAKGDLDLLKPHLRARLDENPDLDLDAIMPEFKEKHPGAFAASSHSGGGSDPTRGSDVHRLGPSSMPMRRSEMSDKQKNEFQKEHGLDALLDLPM